jgi:hypothetical protein
MSFKSKLRKLRQNALVGASMFALVSNSFPAFAQPVDSVDSGADTHTY